MRARILILSVFFLFVLALGVFPLGRSAPDPLAGPPIPQVPVNGGTMVRAKSDYSVSQARALTAFPLYWLGDSFKEIELVAVLRAEAKPVAGESVRANYVNFIYGLCEILPDEEGGCQPPIQVQVWDACQRNRNSYAGEEPDREQVIRGVPSAFFEQDTRLELYTGESTIVLYFARPSADFLREIAENLSGLNVSVSRAQPLPLSPFGRAAC